MKLAKSYKFILLITAFILSLAMAIGGFTVTNAKADTATLSPTKYFEFSSGVEAEFSEGVLKATVKDGSAISFNKELVISDLGLDLNVPTDFTATVVVNGYTYTDTRYIKYEWQSVTLHNSNYKDYLGVGCSNTSYLVSTSVSKKYENLTYTDVTVTFTVRMTGTANNGAGGMGYSKTETIVSGFGQKTTNVSSIGLSGYIFYPSTLTYSVAVSGQVSGYFMTEYLVP